MACFLKKILGCKTSRPPSDDPKPATGRPELPRPETQEKNPQMAAGNTVATTRTISFRDVLKGMLSDFLEKEGIRCPDTVDALLSLVVALSHYTEEGKLLFPKVLLCDNLKATLGLVQGVGPIEVGRGPKGAETMSQALKKCAPLSQGGWAIYVLRAGTEFSYGVFRVPFSPTALDMDDTLVSLWQDSPDFVIILGSQLSDNAVELIGVHAGRRVVYFSDTPVDAPSPRIALDELISFCCRAVPLELRSQVASFLKTALNEATRECHGTIVVVLPADDDGFFDYLTDRGCLLQTPIDLPELVKDYDRHQSEHNLATLKAYGRLLAGMIASDGIVILDERCRIRGYNGFVTSQSDEEASSSGSPVGGARKRAFESLRRLVSQNKLRGCFFRSADGSSTFCGS
jgi:hypothetical protein